MIMEEWGQAASIERPKETLATAARFLDWRKRDGQEDDGGGIGQGVAGDYPKRAILFLNAVCVLFDDGVGEDFAGDALDECSSGVGG